MEYFNNQFSLDLHVTTVIPNDEDLFPDSRGTTVDFVCFDGLGIMQRPG